MWLSNALLRMFLSIYVVFVVAAKRVTNANRLSCVCSLAECENVNESDCPNGAGTVWDSCKCCRVCARVENEPCGGPFGFSGSCAAGLECVNLNFLDKNAAGVCTRIFNKDITCEQPKYVSGCNIVNRRCRCERSKSCADDSSPFSFKTRQECQLNLKSMLTRPDDDEDDQIEGSIADDEEDPVQPCPSDSILLEGSCKCALENCYSCERGFTKTVVRKGTGQPGDCCDHFTCAPNPEKNCTNVTCPEIPTCPADSYQLPALKSENDCCAVSQGCQCLPTCENPCPADLVTVIVTKGINIPGKCCPVINCIDPAGIDPNNNPDESSQDPRDCLSDDMYKKHGTNWTSSDYCTTCTCKNGQPICHASACVPCLKPTPVAGQCCPRCDDTHVQPSYCPQLSNCTERCPNGNLKDGNGCVTCQCRKDCTEGCTSQINSNGEKICLCDTTSPVKCPSIKGCNKKCEFGYQKDENNCNVCECEECNKKCSRGFLTDQKGFSICKCKPWPMPESISTIIEAHPCKTEGSFLRDSGETWFDGCRQCSCIDGKEMCSLIHCSPFTCSNPVVNATSNCCPFCPDDPVTNAEMSHMACSSPNGEIMLEGEMLMLDACTICICHSGMALCRGKECPPTLCSKPTPPAPKECCPTCPRLEGDDNKLIIPRVDDELKCSDPSVNNTAWRESSCLSCHCKGNKKYCYTELCDELSKCKRSLTIKGKCCPICIDQADKYKLEGMCMLANSSYNNGEEWTVDQCTRCKCIAGRTECTKVVCPPSCDESLDYHNMPEILYIVILLIVVGISVALVVCLTRHWRSKKQQLRLRDLGYPPQYQYKYIRTSPYDSKSSQKIILSEKASLAPV